MYTNEFFTILWIDEIANKQAGLLADLPLTLEAAVDMDLFGSEQPTDLGFLVLALYVGTHRHVC